MADPPLNVVVIAGEGAHISIEVAGYERPGATEYYDANWLTASVSIVAGNVGGRFAMAVCTYELTELQSQLRRCLETLSGAFSFRNMESDLALNVEFLKSGKVRISGEASPGIGSSGKLIFAFDSDQSFLAHTLEQLGGILRRFPVKA